MKRKTIPRASIQVGILDDEDFAALTSEQNGYECFGVFIAIVLAVRAAEINPLPWEIAKRKTGKNQNEIKDVIKTISKVADANGNSPWLLFDNYGVIVRSFGDWNTAETRGGWRKGAGRKPKQYQQDKSKENQNEIKDVIKDGIKSESKQRLSVSVPVSVTDKEEEKNGPFLNQFNQELRTFKAESWNLYLDCQRSTKANTTATEKIWGFAFDRRNPDSTEFNAIRQYLTEYAKLAKQAKDGDFVPSLPNPDKFFAGDSWLAELPTLASQPQAKPRCPVCSGRGYTGENDTRQLCECRK